MAKLKVLHLTSTRYGIGGVERLLMEMSSRFDRDAFDVSYCNLFCDADGQGAFPTAVRERGLQTFEIKGRSWGALPGMVLNVAKLLRRERFEIIHLHMLQATIVGGLAAKFPGSSTKVIVTRHYTDELSHHPSAIKKLDAQITSSADAVIAISEYVKRDLLSVGVPPKKVSVIYNGTVVANSPAQSGAGAGSSGDQLYIGTIGSLTERKGHEYLIRSFPLILEQFPNARLIIVGEGPEHEKLEQLRKETDPDERITLLGFQSDVRPILMNFDLYVHPSVHEPFGISILEAMAARKCVVATAVDGVPEIVVDGETGILAKPRDPEQLAAAICEVLRDDDTRRQMGEKGRRRVEEFFDLDITVRRYESLYRKLAGV
ncbi:MAG: glycosyltransferase family 4 protein [Pyrinomonadaceae bacterium]